ncbi:EamA family transporter [Ovoidimarina sediminis]|uniref:EamA family transporter n=1 Tax=Ovoidimarina sediminis TaxID=3079856 RepID=UPI00291278CA|nr:DMT family transporter [Rhodophyticola sp. MJ-SS7]MDU8941789.1 DMT family transporter [Rhodophyticola sp. MJ-SS7]
MLGALLALGSAAFFGLNNAAVRRGVVKGSVLQAMAITVPFGVPMFVLFAALMGGFEAMWAWDVAPWTWMTLAGIVHFVFGRYGNYKATQLLGATLSTPIQQVSILVSLVLAFAFLGETVNLVNVIGILLVVVGPMVVMRRRKATTAAGKAKGFEPQYGPGLFWGAVCAFGYGTSPLFIALGIGEGGIASSVGGLLVSYTAATLVVLVIVALSGGFAALGPFRRETAGWFLVSAASVGLSQFFRYVALAVAPVAVVVPIQRLSVVFRLIFNAMINREHEVFDRWVVATILISVVGAVALAADTGMLLGWLGLSGAGWLAAPLF